MKKICCACALWLVFSAGSAGAAEPPVRSLSRLVSRLILAPDSPALHYELGRIYFKQGIFPQAEKEIGLAMTLAKQSRTWGTDRTELMKAYLQAVRAQRPLASEFQALQDLRRQIPADPEVALWTVEVYLDKGDMPAARNILNGFPQLRQNVEILSRWVEKGGNGRIQHYSVLEERFTDLATLLQIGSDAHKILAARQILDIAGQLPRATVTLAQMKTLDMAFDWLKTRTDTADAEYKLYRVYLDVLDDWRMRDRLKPFILEMRKKFAEARTDPNLSYLMGRLNAGDGRTDEAITLIQESFRLGLDDGGARILLAGLLQKKGLGIESVLTYLTALEGLLTEPDRREAQARVEEWLARQDPENPPAAPDTLFEKLADRMPNSAAAQQLWAGRLERRGQVDRALEKYSLAWSLNGRSKSARMGLARTALRLGRTDDLTRVLAALTLDETRGLWEISPGTILGRRLLQLGDTAAVRRMTQAIQSSASETADRLTMAAELTLAEGRMSDAASIYLRLKQLRPLHENEARMMSVARDQMSQTRAESFPISGRTVEEPYPSTMAEKMAWVRTHPNQPDAAIDLARVMRESGQSDQAIQILAAIDPKSPGVCKLLSQVYADRGEWRMAAGWLEKSGAAGEEKGRTALYLFRAGQYDEAAQYAEKGGLFEAILEAEEGRVDKLRSQNPVLLRTVIGELSPDGGDSRKPSDRWTAQMLSTARRRMESGDCEAALDICRAITARIDAPQARYLEGLTLLRLGLYDDAKNALTVAARSDAWSMPANLRLGQLELIRGRPVEALAYLDKSGPAVDPSELILAWGMALAESKSPEQGQQILEHLAQKSVRGKFFLGKLFEQNGKYKEAIELYKAAVRDDETFVAARYRIGELALKTGDPAFAELSFRTILNQAGAGPYAASAGARMRDIVRSAGTTAGSAGSDAP